MLNLILVLMCLMCTGAWWTGETECSVAIDGLPAAQREQHELLWQDRRSAVDSSVRLRFAGASTEVRLRGPRYAGAATLDADTCPLGTTTLQARPKPARVHFQCAPADLVVRCLDCTEVADRWYAMHEFPPLHFDGSTHERAVAFEFKAVGFAPGQRRVVLHPGPNVVEVHLHAL